jgi:hypothetical protein
MWNMGRTYRNPHPVTSAKSHLSKAVQGFLDYIQFYENQKRKDVPESGKRDILLRDKIPTQIGLP